MNALDRFRQFERRRNEEAVMEGHLRTEAQAEIVRQYAQRRRFEKSGDVPCEK